MSAILSKCGLKPEMKFTCSSCGIDVFGEDILNRGFYMYIVKKNKENILNSIFRCEDCEEDLVDFLNEKNR